MLFTSAKFKFLFSFQPNLTNPRRKKNPDLRKALKKRKSLRKKDPMRRKNLRTRTNPPQRRNPPPRKNLRRKRRRKTNPYSEWAMCYNGAVFQDFLVKLFFAQ